MTGRITTMSMMNHALRAAGRHSARTAEAQEHLSTGVRLNRPSDDPVNVRVALAYNSETSRLEADNHNIRASQSVLNSSVARLIEAKDLLTRAKSIALSSSAEFERDILADQVDHLRTQLVRVANSQLAGDYIFSGTALQTSPFEIQETGEVTYQGSEHRQSVVIGQAITVETSYSGNEIFSADGRNIFDVLADLHGALLDTSQSNSEVQESISTAIGEIDQFSDQILDIVGEQSAALENLTATEFRNEDVMLELERILSGIQNADVAEAVVQLQTEQNLLQYTYITTARIFELNLLDFI